MRSEYQRMIDGFHQAERERFAAMAFDAADELGLASRVTKKLISHVAVYDVLLAGSDYADGLHRQALRHRCAIAMPAMREVA